MWLSFPHSNLAFKGSLIHLTVQKWSHCSSVALKSKSKIPTKTHHKVSSEHGSRGRVHHCKADSAPGREGMAAGEAGGLITCHLHTGGREFTWFLLGAYYKDLKEAIHQKLKTRKKEIEEGTGRWKDMICSWIGRTDTVKINEASWIRRLLIQNERNATCQRWTGD